MTVETAAVNGSLAVGPAPTKKGKSNAEPSNGAGGEVKSPSHNQQIDIIDIRRETDGISIIDEIHKGLRRDAGVEKRLPTLLLYDEAGLRLFEKITYLDQYYLTNEEISVLEIYADQIAQRIADNSVVVELGSGNLRKVNIVLRALERARKRVDYYALDLDRVELERTIADVPSDYQYVKVKGLWGTYDDGAEWLTTSAAAARPKCVISLGSSIGNFSRRDGADFVKQFADILRPGDTLLVGLDGCKEPETVYHAYNDRDGVTHAFIQNGLKHANSLLKREAFDLPKWRAIGEFDVAEGRHQAFVSPVEDTFIEGALVKRDERVRIEESHKYSPHEVVGLFEHASLAKGATWTNGRGNYGLHMASKPVFSFSPKAEVYAARPVPSLKDWEDLWTTWDMVSQSMIPEAELLSKPIKLRNVCLFYLGHIPTFLDIQLAKQTDGTLTDVEYPRIFERGIDPDVDDPEQCHDHSEIPAEWPSKPEILAYQDRVRERVRAYYATNQAVDDRKVSRALWLGFEHEIMHLETLMYMLIQSEKMLPPSGIIPPDFAAMAHEAKVRAVPNDWFSIPARDVTLGLTDPENDDGPNRYFGWDNEKPPHKKRVASFQAKGRPITNGDYAVYMEKTHLDKCPASWSTPEVSQNGHSNGHTNGHSNGHHSVASNGDSSDVPTKAFIQGKAIRTVFGTVPLEYALAWPLAASYDELAGCAAWMGGRIPTAEEVRSIYEHSEELKAKDYNKLAANIPAVNSHLVNDGVEETPPGSLSVKAPGSESYPSPYDHFTDLDGANVGFKHWHPVPVVADGDRLAGQGGMGGLWEWTSSVLERHEGFEPMKLYPVYTADFFDGKHNVVLGGSWATHPRIAGRKTFVNWYQRNYPYAWAGARVVRDD